jgi:hypothetical protein
MPYLNVGTLLSYRFGHANAGHQRIVFDNALTGSFTHARHLENKNIILACICDEPRTRGKDYLDKVKGIAKRTSVLSAYVDVMFTRSGR